MIKQLKHLKIDKMKITRYYLHRFIAGLLVEYLLIKPFSIYPALMLVAVGIQFVYDITRKENN
jgi:hypothetical protein